jgi:GT2 family glycosyltransferase
MTRQPEARTSSSDAPTDDPSAAARHGRRAGRADRSVSDAPPDEVLRLLDERSAARAAGRYDEADALRDRIGGLGWEVQDARTGSTVRPALPATPAQTGYAHPDELASLLDEPASVDLSIQVALEDHPDDLRRLLRGLAAYPPSVPYELIVVANQPEADPEPLLAGGSMGVEPAVIQTAARLGWADSRNLGLRRSRGEITLLLDTSVEPTGEIAAPLLAAFEDPTVGIAGAWGVTSVTARHFHEAPPGEVDAVEAYCLAIRREALRSVGGFDGRFRFYRNADLDLSFAVRDAGWRALAVALPLERHEHRGWAALPEAERDRLSRRNFYRFLKRWGDRGDLLLRPDPPPGPRRGGR